jgi:hypothetical protein
MRGAEGRRASASRVRSPPGEELGVGEPGVARVHALSSCRRRRTSRPIRRENARLGDPSETPPTLVHPLRRSCWRPVEMLTTNGYSVRERETRASNSAMARECSGKHPHLVPIPADKTRLGCASLARDFIWSTSTTLDLCSRADCIPPGHHSVGSLTLIRHVHSAITALSCLVHGRNCVEL